jgi:hypothetical protein
VPVRGELVPGPGAFEIEILDADPRRVKRVRIYPRKQTARAVERAPARRTDAVRPMVPPTEPASLAPEKSDSTSAQAAAERDQPAAGVISKP